jgi:hypothetical protein
VLEKNLINFNKKLIKLENDQFNYNIILQKALTLKDPINLPLYFVIGFILGLFLSLGIVFLRVF